MSSETASGTCPRKAAAGRVLPQPPATLLISKAPQAGCVTFSLQQAWRAQSCRMPFAFSLAGAILPVLLMLSPLAVMATRDCGAWTAPAKAEGSPESTPCGRILPPRM